MTEASVKQQERQEDRHRHQESHQDHLQVDQKNAYPLAFEACPSDHRLVEHHRQGALQVATHLGQDRHTVCRTGTRSRLRDSRGLRTGSRWH